MGLWQWCKALRFGLLNPYHVSFDQYPKFEKFLAHLAKLDFLWLALLHIDPREGIGASL